MKVTVTCFGAVREYLPEGSAGNRAEIELADPDTVGDLVDRLGAPRRLIFSLLVDGTRAGMDATLQDGSEVTLMPPFSGGQAGSSSKPRENIDSMS
ncbi:MAG: MoaD/ThiS family protein [Actinobacteria bacterium]|nr:MoaD/ThiS family protein [Actinomycetota bacterium]